MQKFQSQVFKPLVMCLELTEVGVSTRLFIEEMGQDKPVRRNFSNWLFEAR
jgi:hypothetical protein